jgi:hypothetical protein
MSNSKSMATERLAEEWYEARVQSNQKNSYFAKLIGQVGVRASMLCNSLERRGAASRTAELERQGADLSRTLLERCADVAMQLVEGTVSLTVLMGYQLSEIETISTQIEQVKWKIGSKPIFDRELNLAFSDVREAFLNFKTAIFEGDKEFLSSLPSVNQ